ncbi:hypothetical protein CC80DRAFT_493450, partial [Byssothecium circinans]
MFQRLSHSVCLTNPSLAPTLQSTNGKSSNTRSLLRPAAPRNVSKAKATWTRPVPSHLPRNMSKSQNVSCPQWRKKKKGLPWGITGYCAFSLVELGVWTYAAFLNS